MTLGKMLAASAKAWPRRKAIIFHKRRISYRKLNQWVSNVACGLRSLGLERGEHVAILLPNCPEYIIAAFGVLRAGGVVVPINNFLSPAEVAYILEDCEAKILISGNKYNQQIEACRELEFIKQIILVGDESPDFVAFNQLMLPAECPDLPEIDPEDKALIIYTSGTTGHPKGALLSHRNLLANVASCSKIAKLSRRDRFLLFLPLFHSFTFTVTVLLPLYLGARIILLESIHREEIRRSIIRHRATVMVGIPTVYQLLAQVKLGILGRWLNPVRVYVSGGAPLSAGVLESFQRKFRRPLLEGYGLSEASPVVSINPPHKTKAGSVGLPIPGVEIKVVNNQGKTMAANQIGELLVKGPNVMLGYLNRPRASKSALAGGWLHTGDMARIDEENYVYIVDRRKEMLIVHGANVYPREIENVLCQHPKVSEAAVVGIPDIHRGEIPKAVIVLQPDEEITEREIRHYCRRFLAPYKIPKVVEFRKSLPKTATGKIQKRLL
jgi:long-chain acyl-CoA synthetase